MSKDSKLNSTPMKRGRGRPPGSPNKRTAALREAKRLGKVYGQTPLEFLYEAMKDRSLPMGVRIDLAKAAAPYVHPKLASVTHRGDPSAPVTTKELSDEQYQKLAAELLKKV